MSRTPPGFARVVDADGCAWFERWSEGLRVRVATLPELAGGIERWACVAEVLDHEARPVPGGRLATVRDTRKGAVRWANATAAAVAGDRREGSTRTTDAEVIAADG